MLDRSKAQGMVERRPQGAGMCCTSARLRPPAATFMATRCLAEPRALA